FSGDNIDLGAKNRFDYLSEARLLPLTPSSGQLLTTVQR
ncbi:hypothetical protein RRG08_005816, partial [Elysia crispata]